MDRSPELLAGHALADWSATANGPAAEVAGAVAEHHL
jgi:hypothetical protein